MKKRSLQSEESTLVEIKKVLFIFIFVFIVQLPILMFINYIRRERLLKNTSMIGVIAYSTVIVNLTLWPPVMNQTPLSWSQISYNLVPFKSIIESINHFYYMVGVRNVLGNFVLLLPLAFLLKLRSKKSIILHGLLISLSIEIVQVLLSKTGVIYSRSFDVDDIILNSAGFYFGYGMKELLNRLFKDKRLLKATQKGKDIS